MNKYRTLAGNTLIFAIGSFGAKLLSFLLVSLYTGCLTEAEYGIQNIIYDTGNILVPIVGLAMSEAVIRYGIDKKYDNRKVYTIALCMLALGMTVFAVFTPALGLVSKLRGYCFLLYAFVYCSCFRQVASQFVRSLGYVKLFAADGIISTLTIVIFNVIFMVWLKMGVSGYMLSVILSDALSFLLLTAIAKLHKYMDLKYLDKRLMKDMLRYSVPMIPALIMWWIISSSDRYVLAYMVDDSATGVYSLANRIPTLIMLVSTMFYQAWQMSAISENEDKQVSGFYASVFSAYSSIMFIGSAGVTLFGKLILTLLTMFSENAEGYMEAFHYSPILIASVLFQCFCQFLSTIYSARKKTVNSFWTSFAAAALNIVLNFLLIPKYGIYGAAAATLASYFVCFVIRMFDARRYICFKFSVARFVINTVILSAMMVIASAEPKLCYLWLSLLFILITLLNFKAILRTVKKILEK
ncbi:MAG: polysaccharide biosynthesis C-terminal domain-containing protein [Ruminococcus sp.]|nr:polysaccharide biosynthesis C-terminal domain-containing protein [Ruminococcus sp.]